MHRGQRAGKWRKGVLRGAASPKQHPPSPVRRTHLQTRKIDFRQARREPAGHDSSPGEALPSISARRQRGLRLPLSLERAISFASRSRSGHGSLPAGRSRRFGKHAGSIALRLSGSGGLPLIKEELAGSSAPRLQRRSGKHSESPTPRLPRPKGVRPSPSPMPSDPRTRRWTWAGGLPACIPRERGP